MKIKSICCLSKEEKEALSVANEIFNKICSQYDYCVECPLNKDNICYKCVIKGIFKEED